MKLLSRWWPEATVLALGLVLRLWWAGLPLSTLFQVLEDDAWMVAAIARQWALGHGITADGLTPTNGFHPLYPLTLGALPFLVAPDALDGGFRANMLICAGLNALALGPWYGLLRHLVTRRVALFGLAVIALNPFWVRASVNAMETSLALLCLATLWWYALRPGAWTNRRGITLGVLAAVATLARLDSLLAAGWLGLWLLATWRWRNGGSWRLPTPAIAFGLTTALLLAPYFVRNVLVFGAFAPSSGRALSYLHSYRESFTFTGGVQLLAYNPAINLQWLPTPVLALLIAGLAGVVWLLRRSCAARLAPLVLYALSVAFYYSYLQQQGSPRYYGGVGFALVALLCCGLEALTQRMARRVHAVRSSAFMVGLVVLVCGLNALETVNFFRQQRTSRTIGQPAMYETARWIAANLPPDAIVGAQNSGIMQYYTERVVLNFDGKLNHEIIPVLEQRRLNTYLYSKGVRYVVDLPEVAQYLEFYSNRYTDAPAHQEIGSVGKLMIYARLLAHKVGLGPTVALDVREPTAIKRRFGEDAEVIHAVPLPNDASRAVTVFRLLPGFGAP